MDINPDYFYIYNYNLLLKYSDMKNYMFTEEQVKKVVDHILNEQNEVRGTVMAVQCFLNKVMRLNLAIDGKTGPNSQTDIAFKKFQNERGVWPADGVWGPQTESKLTPEELKIWRTCVTNPNQKLQYTKF